MDLDKLIKLLSEEKNNANKVDILGNIVTLLHEDGNNQVEIYRYLKDWFICYLESLLLKSYRYDVIKNNIVNEKINLLEGMQKLAYVKFIVRNLKKNNLDEYLGYYNNLFEQEELKYLKKNNFLKYLARLATTNLFWLSIFFILSVALFSVVLYLYHESFSNIIIKYSANQWLNYPFNIISIVFNIQGLNTISTIELFLLLWIKAYFFILITYYLLREVTKRMHSD